MCPLKPRRDASGERALTRPAQSMNAMRGSIFGSTFDPLKEASRINVRIESRLFDTVRFWKLPL